MDNQILLLVDENDNFSGQYATRKECHSGKGLHHRAFVVVLYNENGEILLQLRKHKLWDNYWDVSAISHTLHLSDHDETYEEAGLRSLQVEMGITGVTLTKVGGFNYFAEHGENCENEYCAVLVGDYSGEVHPNPEVVYEYKWITRAAFIEDCKQNPSKYTPWAILTAQELEKV